MGNMDKYHNRTWEFYRRGLMFAGETARALGVDHDTLIRYTQAGLIHDTTFDYKGQRWRGWAVTDVLALRRKMGLTP